MGFFKTVRASIYSPAFYRELFSKPASFSVKYFLLLALLVSFVWTLPIAYRLVPEARTFILDATEKAAARYPDELVITVSKGQVSTNVKEPYVIPVPADMKRGEGIEYDNSVVIDTKQPFSDEEFRRYRTLMLVTKDSVAFSKEHEVRIERLDQVPDMTITKANVASLAKRIAPFARVVGPLLVVLVFLWFFVAWSLSTFVYLIFGALVVWAVAKIRKVPAGYRMSYQIAIHADTLPFLLIPLTWPFTSVNVIAYFPTILLAAVAWINLSPEADSAASLP